jgi:hypothetical protein
VTLTEILISIMILGVGMISLATLFPLGLLRLRNAQRWTRSAYLDESANADLAARNLLTKFSFTNAAVSPWYVTANGRYDPWVQDTPAYPGVDWWAGGQNLGAGLNPAGAYRGRGGTFLGALQAGTAKPGPGLPVAYDPLWRAVATTTLNGVQVQGVYIDNTNAQTEARFGSGIGWLRSPGGGGNPSANGLQRVTNLAASALGTLPVANGYPAPIQQVQFYHVATETFVSPEDIVFQDAKNGQYIDPFGSGNPITSPSPLAVDLSQFQQNSGLPIPTAAAGTVTVYPPVADWRYTWMFTGEQTDSLSGYTFDGNVVIFENRQFSLDPATNPPFAGGSGFQVAGETVYEAVFGFGTNVFQVTPGFGYAKAAKRTVLLLWPSTVPDPDVRVGQWIADVTYERNEAVALTRYPPGTALYPPQRCYWYQIAKRTEPGPATVGFAPAGYRQMTVWTSTDLRAQSMLSAAGVPANVEAALIAPTVVNVIPRTIYTR